jgi:REP element-mobilizing transposase RayT
MARMREEAPGAVHHAFARGVNRQPIFLDDADYQRYIRTLRATAERYRWRVLTFCLMPNHVHLLVETPTPNLGSGMQWLQSRYALSFNDKHGRSGEGHVFQGPYRSKRVKDELGFLRVATYVTMNAVAGGLCAHPAEWRWSSHGLVSRGLGAQWLAHDAFCERLEALTGTPDFVSTIVL